VRCFVAVDVSPDVREAIARAQARVRAAARRADVRWVEPAGFHLTLKFLGAVAPVLAASVSAVLAGVAGAAAPIPIAAGGLGVFPGPSRPRVVWAGLTTGVAALGRLAAAVEDALGPLGFPPEARPFGGHVTIGRVRSPRGGRILAAAIEAARAEAFGAWTAEEIVLYESRLRPTGAVYEAVTRHRLGWVGHP